MRNLFLLGIFMCLALTSNAHEYFFGFADLSYNAKEEVYEGTLILSTHDVEEWFIEKGVELSTFEDHIDDYDMHRLMELELFEGFKIKVDSENLHFQMIGYELLESGQIQFYFHSQEIQKGSELDITFDLMMAEYPKQQNKINYADGNKTFTAVFIANHTQSSISLK